jgi:hypothetical protein
MLNPVVQSHGIPFDTFVGRICNRSDFFSENFRVSLLVSVPHTVHTNLSLTVRCMIGSSTYKDIFTFDFNCLH